MSSQPVSLMERTGGEAHAGGHFFEPFVADEGQEALNAPSLIDATRQAGWPSSSWPV